MSFRSEPRVRRVIYAATALSVMGAASAFIDFSFSRGTVPVSGNDGPASAAVRRLPASTDPAVKVLDASAEHLFHTPGKQDRADIAATETPVVATHEAGDAAGQAEFITASLTPVEMAYAPRPMVRIYQDVNRGAKADRLSLPQMTVSKLIAQEQVPLDAHASAAVFLVAPPLANAQTASRSETAASETAGAGQTTLSAADHPVKARSAWAELVRLASVKGGDGEDKNATIFGGLTEQEFRARELRCMATAVYFEARDEPLRGQIAVAQVIMTRVRSEYYPMTICGVVYQGQWNRNACQFSFACDGKADAPTEKKEWATSLDVARQVISGKVYLTDIGGATHYHATYVHPDWTRMVKRIKRIGGHIFYKASFAPPLIANAEYNKL
jgi:spore germination cell wall hydrolase CwlJ-like protein